MARILVIDDEPLVCETFQLILEQAGHEIVVAADGKQGIEKFSARPTQIVVTDIMMPEKEGIETIADLRRISPDVKIIAVSGGTQIRNVDFSQLAKKYGADHTLQKPVKRATLLETVDSCLAAAGRKSRVVPLKRKPTK